MAETSLNIINSIMTRCGLNQNIVAKPFESPNVEIKEIINLLNDKIETLTSEIEFTQIKRECKFRVWKSWKQGTYATGDSAVSNGIRYLCINGGISDVVPNGTGIFTMNLEQPWAAGIPVVAGQNIISNMKLWRVLNTGTTGSTAPSDGEIVSDGEIDYQYIREVLFWENKGSYEKYPFDEIAPDIKSMSPNTIVDLDRRRYLQTLTDEQWNKRKATNIIEYSVFYMVANGALWLYPNYAEGSEISFFYYSTNPVNTVDIDGTITEWAKKNFTTETDQIKLPDQLLKWGVAAQWLKQKGLQTAAYAEEQYDKLLDRALAENKTNTSIPLNGPVYGFSNIDDGSWNLGA